MNRGGPVGRVALALPVLVLAGCATPNAGNAPKTVQGYALPSYQIHEECLVLNPGERVEYRFESTEPVDFNLHYHEGKAIVMPLVREKSREDAGVYAVTLAQDYCLMWEAGAAGAVLDYRVRVTRPES